MHYRELRITEAIHTPRAASTGTVVSTGAAWGLMSSAMCCRVARATAAGGSNISVSRNASMAERR